MVSNHLKAHRLVIFGPPGSGKGTQSKLLAKKLNIEHVSTGEILRDAVSSGSALGKNIANTLALGNLVADEIVSELVRNLLLSFVKENKKGFIFDGYPRTFDQVVFFEKTLTELDLEITRAVELSVPLEQILDRIKARAVADKNARSDDSVSIARKRYEIFKAECEPVVRFYRDRGLLVSLDGVGTIDEINEKIIKSLN